jgi:hypothetical protein
MAIDEAQDISLSHLRFFAALGAGRANALFFAGDLGKRIFQQPFSWKSLGVDIRGRSRTPASKGETSGKYDSPVLCESSQTLLQFATFLTAIET